MLKENVRYGDVRGVRREVTSGGRMLMVNGQQTDESGVGCGEQGVSSGTRGSKRSHPPLAGGLSSSLCTARSSAKREKQSHHKMREGRRRLMLQNERSQSTSDALSLPKKYA